MTPIVLQTWAAAALWMACVALGMRANMLKPQIAAWCSPPLAV